MEKTVVFLAYNGAGFKGMQKNPGAQTVEGLLEASLVRAGAIGCNGYCKNWLDWKRAARTDKDVSAVGQVVSGRFYPVENLADRLNTELPSSIRVLGSMRVEDWFSAKSMCDSRRYEYILPLFALDPAAYCAREYRKCGNDNSNQFVFDHEKFNGILSRFIGTHNFHNFSWHVKSGDLQAQRTIVSFKAENNVFIQGDEYVKLVVVGKSFMVYQIRKMVGLAVAVMRNLASSLVINTALTSEVDLVVPTAPSHGLLLDECIYQNYNENIPKESRISFQVFQSEMQEFKVKNIYPHIAKNESDHRTVARWLPSLNSRNYSALASTP